MGQPSSTTFTLQGSRAGGRALRRIAWGLSWHFPGGGRERQPLVPRHSAPCSLPSKNQSRGGGPPSRVRGGDMFPRPGHVTSALRHDFGFSGEREERSVWGASLLPSLGEIGARGPCQMPPPDTLSRHLPSLTRSSATPQRSVRETFRLRGEAAQRRGRPVRVRASLDPCLPVSEGEASQSAEGCRVEVSSDGRKRLTRGGRSPGPGGLPHLPWGETSPSAPRHSPPGKK